MAVSEAARRDLYIRRRRYGEFCDVLAQVSVLQHIYIRRTPFSGYGVSLTNGGCNLL